jgi:uncharacterized membrane protein YcaP (DUF421 family)
VIEARILFDGWAPLVRTLVVGVLSYASLVVLLRVSGKRTLSKMNAFDFVVTVALGSTLASVLTSSDMALARGLVAFALLIGLQLAITWGSVRSRWIDGLVKSEPSLLLSRGELLRAAMRRERVTEDEVRAAARASGIDALEQVDAVILETDGSFSVVRRSSAGDVPPAMRRPRSAPRPAERPWDTA